MQRNILILLGGLLTFTTGCVALPQKPQHYKVDKCAVKVSCCNIWTGCISDALCISRKQIAAQKELACRDRQQANKPIIIEQCDYDAQGNKTTCTKTTKEVGE